MWEYDLKEMLKPNSFHVGDEIMFIDCDESRDKHKGFPCCYPKIYTRGTIIGFQSSYASGKLLAKVRWHDGSTSCDDEWTVPARLIKAFN